VIINRVIDGGERLVFVPRDEGRLSVAAAIQIKIVKPPLADEAVSIGQEILDRA
jgi:hypothetical protein